MAELQQTLLRAMPLVILGAVLAVAAVMALTEHHRRRLRSAARWRAALDVGIVTSVLLVLLVTLPPIAEGRGADLTPLLPTLRVLDRWTPGRAATVLLGNVALFVPFGAAVALRSRHPLRSAVVAALTLSIGVELLQYALGGGRTAQTDDVLLNVLGGALAGALVARCGRGRRRPRRPLR